MDYDFVATFLIASLMVLTAGGAISMFFFWLNPNPYRGSMWTALCVMAGATGSLAVGSTRVSLPSLEITIGASEATILGVLVASVIVFVCAAVLNYLSREDIK
jgi:hypothetical protein